MGRHACPSGIEVAAAVSGELTEAELVELRGLAARRSTAQAMALRVRIVLASAPGNQNKQVAAALGCDPQIVRKWRERFIAQRMDGLRDEPRPGAPRLIDDERIEATIVRTLESVPPDLDVHLVTDSYATHKTQMVRDWLAKRPRWHVHLTPTSSSWLNQIERFFALITDKQIRRGIHQSVDQLKACIESFIQQHNEAPNPSAGPSQHPTSSPAWNTSASATHHQT